MLQFWIALFTGMVAATFVPPVRKAISRPVEVAIWIAFVTVCVVGVTSITDKGARDLATTVLWAAQQVAYTIFGHFLAAVGQWLDENRLAVASLLVLVACANVVVLVLVRAIRRAAPWTPGVHLRDWMEMPAREHAAEVPGVASGPLVVIDRRVTAATGAVAVTAAATALDLSARLRATIRQAEARMDGWPEAIRNAAAHLNFAGRTWFEGTGVWPSARRAGRVIDIRALLGAWTAEPTKGEVDDNVETRRPDSMAS